MPVVATPSPTTPSTCCDPPYVQPVLTPVACAGQNVLSAPVSRTVHKRPLLNRMRAFTIRGGQQAILRWQLHDAAGNPVDISACAATCSSSESLDGSSYLPSEPSQGLLLLPQALALGSECLEPYQLKLRIREDLSLGKYPLPKQTEFPATILDAAQGIVQAIMPAQSTNVPGVYFAEWALVGTDTGGIEYVLFSNTCYLYIDRSMWSRRGPHGPPSIAEIRLHLRDSNNEESFLLDNLKFDNAEIAHAAAVCVGYWNEQPPDVQPFTTQSFPFRFHWIEGICAQLFMMAAEQFRANNLKYSAAGVSVDDQDKEPNYERAAEGRQQVWRDFVRRKKAEINLEAGWGGIGSQYAYYGYGRRMTGDSTCR